MRKLTLLFTSLLVCVFFTNPLFAASESKSQKKRVEIDANCKETLDRLYKEETSVKGLISKAYGYAVFHNTQTALMISGGSGSGVAIEKKTGKRRYMRMASGGVGIGLGIQVMDVVFIFETKEKFDLFVEKGWDADTSAGAAAAEQGINKAATFNNGLAIYQLTDKGLIAQASLKGTKYWIDDKLNSK